MNRRTTLFFTLVMVLSALAVRTIEPVVGQSARSSGSRHSTSQRTDYDPALSVQTTPSFDFQLRGPEYEAQRELTKEDRQLDTETRAILGRYKQSEDSNQRAELEQQLQKIVEQHFDVRHRQRELEIADVAERLRRLQEQLDKRKAARDDIIQNRLDQLLREATGLGWGANQSADSNSSVWFYKGADGKSSLTPVKTKPAETTFVPSRR